MPKFYTAFLYRPTSTAPHCTHKYLGELDIDRFLAVAEVINLFNPFSVKAPFAVFNRAEIFGKPESPVRVLTTPDRDVFQPFDLLRELLDAFNKDDFKFNPHVTTQADAPFYMPFTHYALCTGRTVIFAWPLKSLLLNNTNFPKTPGACL